MDRIVKVLDFERGFWKLALLLGLLACLLLQGSRGILETTEGRYSESAWETISTCNILEPLLNGEHHWTKPPLTYWAIGAGTMLLGNNPWGARAYLVIAFLLTVTAVHALDLALWKRSSIGLAALVFATSPIAIAASNTIATDALLTLWEGWTFAFYWLGVRSGKRHHTMLMWLALALAVATKGPVGLLPLAAIIPAFMYVQEEDWRWLIALWPDNSPIQVLRHEKVGSREVLLLSNAAGIQLAGARRVELEKSFRS